MVTSNDTGRYILYVFFQNWCNIVNWNILRNFIFRWLLISIHDLFFVDFHPGQRGNINLWNKSLSDTSILIECNLPDSKAHGANMWPTWVLSSPGGPHVGPTNLAIKALYIPHTLWCSSAFEIGTHAMCCHVLLLSDTYGTWASYQIRKIAGCACDGNNRNVFLVTDFKANR